MVKEDADLKKVTTSAGDLSATIRGSAKASTALRNVTSGDNTHSSERGKSRSKTRAWVGQEMI